MSNLYDFEFGWEGATGPNGPWGQLLVVQFKGHEAISELGHFELVLLAKAPAADIDPQELIDARCTLRIKTLSHPAYRVIHGVVTEAQEMYSITDGMLYRVKLMPPLARAEYRTRCRIFLEKTLRQIVDAVLQGDPNLRKAEGDTVEEDNGETHSFKPAVEHYTWRISNSPRLDQVSARPYVVQYNESDFHFVARLLEEEGISFHYEHGQDKALLVLADEDAGRSRLHPFLPVGPQLVGRDMEQIQLGGRLRATMVELDDYNWKKPAVDMLTHAGNEKGASFFEYAYPGGYPDSPQQGHPLATNIQERYKVEADYAAGEGKPRMLFPGCIYSVQHPKARYDGEYLLTKLVTVGNQPGVTTHAIPWIGQFPFKLECESIRRGKDGNQKPSNYRPARRTIKPRIGGSQTAFVTTEPSAPGATVHVGDMVGCVRLRFHWDRENNRLAKEASSCWVRVSQFNAGGNMGAVWHPRVGDEVIVEFLEGDPDRPIVTGRVYNGALTPPAPSVGSPTISTIKTFTIPGGGQYNEYLFDDKAGAEEIRQHAARDWNSVTEHSRTELVKVNSHSTIGVNRTEATGANRSTTVGANNSEAVGANESIKIGSNQTITVGVNQTETIGGSQKLTVMGAQKYTLNAGQTFDITGGQHFSVEGAQSTKVSGGQSVNVGGSASTHSGGEMSLSTSADQTAHAAVNQKLTAGATQALSSTDLKVHASASIHMQTSAQTEKADTMDLKAGGSYKLSAGDVHITSGGTVHVHGGEVVIDAGTVTIKGGPVGIKGSPINVDGGGSVKMVAGVIKLN